MSLYSRGGKRALDMAVAGGALVVLSPILLGLAVIVALRLGRPVLFRQERTGWQRRPFMILKFRSMLDAVDANGHPLPDEQRLTPLGRWLRSSSLDELTGLVNVLRGEMSLVGPRPFVHVYDRLYSAEQARRFEVRPGLTGWAQINGRNAIGWPEKFALDVWYVDHQSFWLDMKILVATTRRVLSRHGVNAGEAVTMPPFAGETMLPPCFDPGQVTSAGQSTRPAAEKR